MNKINFTKANIDALPTPESGKRDIYHDSKTPGLQLRVTSVKTFFINKRIKGGNPERITLGRYPDITIEQARRKTKEIIHDMAEGINPAEIKRGKKAELTFSELFNEYLELHSKPNKKTWDEDLEKYNNHIKKHIGKIKLSLISRTEIASIHNNITKKGFATAANRTLALISSVYGWAISTGRWNVNPALGIRRNKETSRERFIQGDELPKFFQAVAEEENESIRDYILLSLLTGARRSNVLSMRWQDINFERAEWRIQETKNGTPQTVVLSPESLAILQNRNPLKCAVFVFPGKGKSGHLVEPKKGWKRILEGSGIKDLRIHDLRRTLGSWQAKTGASLVIIGKSLNHKNQSSTGIYARLDLDPIRESINKATSAMLRAAGLKKDADIMPLKKKTIHE